MQSQIINKIYQMILLITLWHCHTFDIFFEPNARVKLNNRRLPNILSCIYPCIRQEFEIVKQQFEL